MKPQQPDIDWILKNAKLVMRWLERRGGLEAGDWVWLNGRPQLVSRTNNEGLVLIHTAWYRIEYVVWLPSVGDVLEMLEVKGYLSDLCTVVDPDGQLEYLADAVPNYASEEEASDKCDKGGMVGDEHAGPSKTPLIALMEVLKAVVK